MQELLLKIITLAHVLFVIFVIISPFVNSNYLLLLHSVMVPFVILHWIMNDNTCVLTIIERNIKKQLYKETYKDDECFTCRLIEPVYNFIDDNKTFSKMIYFLTGILWIVSFGRLVCKYNNGQITNWTQLFVL